MKSIAVIPDERTVKLIEREEPKLKSPSDVKLQMLEVGVCGTDREICSFQYGTPPIGSDYLVIGHESLGEVAAVGPAVAGLKPGDLVVTMVRRPCLHEECVSCVSGHADFCYTTNSSHKSIATCVCASQL
jgi:glucose 1-dehydrogenase